MLSALLALALAVAPAPAVDPYALTLRLSDLPRGYAIQDLPCRPGGNLDVVEGAPARLRALLLRFPPKSCSIDFQDAWYRNLPQVASNALVFGSTAGAAAVLADARELTAQLSSVSSWQASGGARVGDESVLLGTRGAFFLGHPGYPGAAVLWRRGRVLAALIVVGPTTASAQSLAERQDRRLRQPSPATAAQFDSTLVPLDNPRLKQPLYWVGRLFRARGLSAVELFHPAVARPGDSIGPGDQAKLDYVGAPRFGPGFSLDVWAPSAWARFARTRLGREVWSAPCAARRAVRLPTGHAVIYHGCGAATHAYLAHVFLPGAVVTVDQPYCYGCTTGAGAYSSWRGIEAVVRALRRYSPSQ